VHHFLRALLSGPFLQFVPLCAIKIKDPDVLSVGVEGLESLPPKWALRRGVRSTLVGTYQRTVLVSAEKTFIPEGPFAEASLRRSALSRRTFAVARAFPEGTFAEASMVFRRSVRVKLFFVGCWPEVLPIVKKPVFVPEGCCFCSQMMHDAVLYADDSYRVITQHILNTDT
jgi:hypothetical protein